MTITVKTTTGRSVIDITEQVGAQLEGHGLVNILIKHTTAALTTADLDPGTDLDFLDALEAMTPQEKWRHPHDPGHFPDHLWASIIGSSITLPYSSGELLLGTWQRLILIDFAGPREREIELTFV